MEQTRLVARAGIVEVAEAEIGIEWLPKEESWVGKKEAVDDLGCSLSAVEATLFS